MSEPFNIISITFTNEDVKSIADEYGIDHDTAFARVDEWSKPIEGNAVSSINERLASVIRTGEA